ncbi:MAG TPA: hypothetical protein VGJ15_08435, partial [Pirellulales bacterium]
LFGILLALATNTNFTEDPGPRSKLTSALQTTPIVSQYMYALWLDWPHSYRFVSGDVQDYDHTVTAELQDSEGKQKTFKFPPDGSKDQERERYEALAQRLTPLDEENSDSSLLARIGEGLIAATGAKEVTIRIERHAPLPIKDAQSDDPGQRDPNNKRMYSPAYAATISLNSDGVGEVHPLNQEARDVAPVTKRPLGNQSSSPGTALPPRPVAGSLGPRRSGAPPLPPPEPGKKIELPNMLPGIVPPEPEQNQ